MYKAIKNSGRCVKEANAGQGGCCMGFLACRLNIDEEIGRCGTPQRFARSCEMCELCCEFIINSL